MMKHLLAVAAICVIAPVAHAQGVRAVEPIQGYVCKVLDITEAQALDTRWAGVPILTEPNPAAPRGTIAAAVVFAKEPAHIVNGYAEVLQLTGQPGWIAADKIKPYRSASNPHARCTPSVLSNGRLGIG
jgi:hypothetical protein